MSRDFLLTLVGFSFGDLFCFCLFSLELIQDKRIVVVGFQFCSW
jgi:hypothetical protein